jgi:hypothetical protein
MSALVTKGAIAPDVYKKKDRLAAVSRRSRDAFDPRLRRLGFLNGPCGVADHVQHGMRLGEHRDVTARQLDGGGAHLRRDKTFKVGMDGAVVLGHN